jgi:two-component sensor histidine kinase
MGLWDCDDPDRVVGLLTSELVTNALRHAADTVCLRVFLDGDILRVQASDEDLERPHVCHPASLGEGGRGMRLIDSLALRWGAAPLNASAKVVWFEIAVNSGRRARPPR